MNATLPIDPVCGMTVDPASPLRMDYGGTTYFVCAPSCLARFRANPDSYLGGSKPRADPMADLDAIKSGAREALDALRAEGLRIVMLTGDARAPALAIGAELGFDPDDIRAEVLPAQKRDDQEHPAEPVPGVRVQRRRRAGRRRRALSDCGRAGESHLGERGHDLQLVVGHCECAPAPAALTRSK